MDAPGWRRHYFIRSCVIHGPGFSLSRPGKVDACGRSVPTPVGPALARSSLPHPTEPTPLYRIQRLLTQPINVVVFDGPSIRATARLLLLSPAQNL